VLRSAEVLGATAAVLPRHRAVGITPAVTKAAAGAIEHLPISFVGGVPNALEQARRADVWCVGLDAGGDQSVFDVAVADQPIVLVLGAEGHGLSRLTRARCDTIVSIPMLGRVESLNVSAAAAIACAAVARARAGA
jgi:23S rRNA (guanosine2251-2'-O)-methyltransferase